MAEDHDIVIAKKKLITYLSLVLLGLVIVVCTTVVLGFYPDYIQSGFAVYSLVFGYFIPPAGQITNHVKELAHKVVMNPEDTKSVDDLLKLFQRVKKKVEKVSPSNSAQELSKSDDTVVRRE